MMKYKSIHSDIWLASRYSNSTQINKQDNTYYNSMVYNILVRSCDTVFPPGGSDPDATLGFDRGCRALARSSAPVFAPSKLARGR